METANVVTYLMSVVVGVALAFGAVNAAGVKQRLFNIKVMVPVSYAFSIILSSIFELHFVLTFLALTVGLIYFKDKATYIERSTHVMLALIIPLALIGVLMGESSALTTYVKSYVLGVVAGVTLPVIIIGALILTYVAFHPLLLFTDIVLIVVSLVLLLATFKAAELTISGVGILFLIVGLIMGAGHVFANLYSFMVVKPARKIGGAIKGKLKKR